MQQLVYWLSKPITVLLHWVPASCCAFLPTLRLQLVFHISCPRRDSKRCRAGLMTLYLPFISGVECQALASVKLADKDLMAEKGLRQNMSAMLLVTRLSLALSESISTPCHIGQKSKQPVRKGLCDTSPKHRSVSEKGTGCVGCHPGLTGGFLLLLACPCYCTASSCMCPGLHCYFQ